MLAIVYHTFVNFKTFISLLQINIVITKFNTKNTKKARI